MLLAWHAETILYHIILYYIILYKIIQYYTILYNIKQYYTILYSIILYYTIFYNPLMAGSSQSHREETSHDQLLPADDDAVRIASLFHNIVEYTLI